MRIEAYGQVAQVYKQSNTGSKTRAAEMGNRRDEVQISHVGYDYQVAKQAVAAISDIREDKVAQLSAQIESGNYKVSADDFASRVIEKYKSFII